MVWKCFVLPGVEETLTFFSPIKELMVLDFPTLGYPTSPIDNFEGGLPDASWNSENGPSVSVFGDAMDPLTRERRGRLFEKVL